MSALLMAGIMREIAVSEWAHQPMMATFGVDRRMVGMNGIAAVNYKELEAQARALVEPLRNRLLMRDLELDEEEIGEGEDAVNEEEAGASMGSHHYFTGPDSLAGRSRFVRVGMHVRERDTDGAWVTGEVIAGHWRTVMLRDEEGKKHPGVEVTTLEALSMYRTIQREIYVVERVAELSMQIHTFFSGPRSFW